jgi:hypothetical protein
LDPRFSALPGGKVFNPYFVLDHGHDGLENLVVARAATQIARHPLLRLLFGGARIAVEEGLGGDDLSGGADAALKTAVFQKRLL